MREVNPERAAAARATQSQPNEIVSGDLFGKRQELVILHCGEAYRLRITRLNKLILTK